MPAGLTGKIVFASGKNSDYDIWALDFDSNRLLQLTHGREWNDKPRWSPDGRRVVFVGSAQGTPGIYTVAADGGGPVTPLIQNGRWNDFPAYSPDGKLLGYVSNVAGNNDIWIAEADGSNPRQLTRHPGDDTYFAWSPDGRSVLFSSDREGNADIWRYDLKSGRTQQLTSDLGMDIHPAPSPDGRFIAFVSNRQVAPTRAKSEWDDRDLDVWLMTADGAHQTRITENQGCDRCVTWSPDGGCLMYSSSRASESAERLRIVNVGELLEAYRAGDARAIDRAAERLRSTSVAYDRRRLEREAGAVRNPFFLTTLLPDFLMRRAYGEAYWGTERYPDWHAGSGATQERPAWDVVDRFV